MAVVLLGLVALLIWNETSQRRAIRSLPEAERHELYQRTKASLEQLCESPSQGLNDYCREQAEFLSKFPECDSSCRALIARQRSR